MAQFVKKGQFRALLNSSSLKAFYDDIVYWEIAKNNNRFFVTFMEGQYGVNNSKQESIGTAEISFPRTKTGESQKSKFDTGFNRVSVVPKTFMVNDETGSKNNAGTEIQFPNSHNYNGFIPITELRGTRFFESTLTASRAINNTYTYQLHDETTGNNDPGTITKTRTVRASYFYPFSSHQLSVLREEPTVIIDLAKESELYNGVGEKGFVIVPQETDIKLRDNIEYYLEKAGLIEKTTTTKAPRKGR